MRALYSKNGSLCAKNGALIVGPDNGEPPCVCGGGGPGEDCDDGACCENDSQCTPRAAPPTGGVNASIRVTGFIEVVRQKRTREGFTQRSQRQPATVTTTNPGSLFLLNYADPQATGCGTLGGAFSVFVDDGIDWNDLACGPIGPVRHVDHTVAGSVSFDPKARINALGVSNGLAKYDVRVRCGVSVVEIQAVCYRSGSRPGDFPATARAQALIGTDGNPVREVIPEGFVIAQPLNACGTQIRVTVFKPAFAQPFGVTPDGCPLPDFGPSDECRICTGHGAELEIIIDAQDLYRACEPCQPALIPDECCTTVGLAPGLGFDLAGRTVHRLDMSCSMTGVFAYRLGQTPQGVDTLNALLQTRVEVGPDVCVLQSVRTGVNVGTNRLGQTIFATLTARVVCTPNGSLDTLWTVDAPQGVGNLGGTLQSVNAQGEMNNATPNPGGGSIPATVSLGRRVTLSANDSGSVRVSGSSDSDPNAVWVDYSVTMTAAYAGFSPCVLGGGPGGEQLRSAPGCSSCGDSQSGGVTL